MPIQVGSMEGRRVCNGVVYPQESETHKEEKLEEAVLSYLAICRKCDVCQLFFPTSEEALKCLHSHRLCRCFVCFKTVRNEKKRIGDHYRRKHVLPEDEAVSVKGLYFVRCPFCPAEIGCLTGFDAIKNHVLKEHPENELMDAILTGNLSADRAGEEVSETSFNEDSNLSSQMYVDSASSSDPLFEEEMVEFITSSPLDESETEEEEFHLVKFDTVESLFPEKEAALETSVILSDVNDNEDAIVIDDIIERGEDNRESADSGYGGASCNSSTEDEGDEACVKRPRLDIQKSSEEEDGEYTMCDTNIITTEVAVEAASAVMIFSAHHDTTEHHQDDARNQMDVTAEKEAADDNGELNSPTSLPPCQETSFAASDVPNNENPRISPVSSLIDSLFDEVLTASPTSASEIPHKDINDSTAGVSSVNLNAQSIIEKIVDSIFGRSEQSEEAMRPCRNATAPQQKSGFSSTRSNLQGPESSLFSKLHSSGTQKAASSAALKRTPQTYEQLRNLLRGEPHNATTRKNSTSSAFLRPNIPDISISISPLSLSDNPSPSEHSVPTSPKSLLETYLIQKRHPVVDEPVDLSISNTTSFKNTTDTRSSRKSQCSIRRPAQTIATNAKSRTDSLLSFDRRPHPLSNQAKPMSIPRQGSGISHHAFHAQDPSGRRPSVIPNLTPLDYVMNYSKPRNTNHGQEERRSQFPSPVLQRSPAAVGRDSGNLLTNLGKAQCNAYWTNSQHQGSSKVSRNPPPVLPSSTPLAGWIGGMASRRPAVEEEANKRNTTDRPATDPPSATSVITKAWNAMVSEHSPMLHSMLASLSRYRKCPKCQKEFDSHHRDFEQLFKRHLDIHDGIWPFVCKICPKTFLTGKAFRTHAMQQHSIFIPPEQEKKPGEKEDECVRVLDFQRIRMPIAHPQ